jgi:hypothetical protein
MLPQRGSRQQEPFKTHSRHPPSPRITPAEHSRRKMFLARGDSRYPACTPPTSSPVAATEALGLLVNVKRGISESSKARDVSLSQQISEAKSQSLPSVHPARGCAPVKLPSSRATCSVLFRRGSTLCSRS